ncbi:hypothetical protein HRI_001433500 [Hibiscus trionum]|uniref:NAC domain-containing protein n=1 Tax=Hibiscus trionum TaxID=183268 RepID=A0A9W7LU53_HIBTR|nr:hypothetical protein HRI_001433500 [Hibiscus trionum]
MDLPTGFRFHPTDEELINHYLKPKVLLSSSDRPIFSIIADLNIYKFDPWELPDKACFGEEEWFFFSPRERKYPNGTRPNRAAASGFWKASGIDKPIITSVGSQCLGMKRALVFYKGRPPKGVKTDWVMTEYRLLNDYFLSHRPKGSMRLDDWVLCRVSHKNKATQQVRGRSSDSCMSSSCSPPLTRGYLQGQEMVVVTQNTIIQGDDSHTPSSQTTIDADSREVLNSIARVLSVGAFDELFGSSSTSSNNNGSASVFQISSPAQSFSDV